MKRFAVPLAALLFAACSDAPTAPVAVDEAAPIAGPSFSSSGAGQSLTFDSDLNFIDGMVPEFDDAGAGARFGELMKELRAHLAAGNRTEASRVLGLARKELAPGALNEGDTGYLEMVFRDIDEALAQ